MREQGVWGPARLAATRDLTADIRLFEIEPEGGFVAPSPGSHIKVAVTIGGRADVRSYSTVGPCRDGRYRVAVKRLMHSRGGSAWMWTLRPGARLTVCSPANHFELGRGPAPVLLLAGGIGVTPLYGMALALAEAGRPFRILYAARSSNDHALADDLRTAIGERLRLFADDAGEKLDVPAEIAKLPPTGELYVCGPIGMLEAAKSAWRDSGRPAVQLRFETFGASGRYPSEPFIVSIPRLGRDILIPANRSILDTLEAEGVGVMSDCRRGECGLCALTILSATHPIDHRDVFFSDEEKAQNGKLCACVSRGAGGVVSLEIADRSA